MFLCTTLFLLHLSASFHSCLADSEVNASHSSLRAGSSVGGINRVLTGTTYSCPNVGAEPTLLSEGGIGDFFTVQIEKSTSGIPLCVLFHVTPRDSSIDINTISSTSKTDDFNIVPVARSYSGFSWERVAGTYAHDLEVTSCTTGPGACSLQIPNVLNDLDNSNNVESKFILMSFTHSLSSQEQVSRFYQQTTFGPTKQMIDSWNYNAPTVGSEMANWVKSQMDETQTPSTLHRSYYRKHLDRTAVFEGGSPDGQLRWNDHYHPRHPCSQYARWREYSFTVDDYYQPVVATPYGAQWLLSVRGVPRTLVSQWKNDLGHNIGQGQFLVCWHPEEVLNGVLKVIIGNRCTAVFGGNPRVNLPAGIYGAYNNIRVIDLPSRASFGTVAPILSSSYHVEHLFGEALYLMNGIWNHQCYSAGMDGRYYGVLGNIPGYGQVYYAGTIEVHENTLDNPMLAGGAALMSGVKPICPVPATSFLNVRDSCYLSTDPNACSSSYTKTHNGDAVLVCGSPGEIANDPLSRGFGTLGDVRTKTTNQKRNAWAMIAMDADDQLRQRMAWALSQIVVITPNQIADIGYSEIYLNYYDIFVRNAFGNYFDILKEVSYSPMMAEMLSYVDSKSSSFVYEQDGTFAFPDENYAREVMQLFSVGVSKLNIDGTLRFDDAGSPISTYDNDDIQNFARAWTGFTRQDMRSNFEAMETEWLNRMDPMKIEASWRDPFPKMDLHSGFIGDKKPLCVDLPDKQFLHTGAKYRLLGSSRKPDLHHQSDSRGNLLGLKVVVLDHNSILKGALSGLQPEVTLELNIPCTGAECALDNVRLVQVQQTPPIFYEYIRPECVELSFYDSGKKISTKYVDGTNTKKSMCANSFLDVAFGACCTGGESYATPFCKFDIERTSYHTAQTRCTSEVSGGNTCNWAGINFWSAECSSFQLEENWHWTDQDCTMKVKVKEDGMVAIVHDPSLLHSFVVEPRVDLNNPNFFKISWDSEDYPRPSTSCASSCQVVNDACLCDVSITESQVFTSLPATVDDVMSQLHVGAPNPEIFGNYIQITNTGDVEVWQKENSGYNKDTIFAVSHRGKNIFLKNILSTVAINGAPALTFRNPPHFVNIAVREPRDVVYETDDVLETYFHHDNLAPFLALRLIQRFGISNPSPRYTETVSKAFIHGTYVGEGQTFGDGRYGNLEAMVAAIVLDREATTVVLDADPASGSLKEPMVKIISFMRAMDFERRVEAGDEIRMDALQAKVGQEAHSSPGVFSFFLPEYAAPGHIKAAALYSPEAQLLSGPKIISLLNGIISLVDLGLTECFGGFAQRNLWQCNELRPGGTYDTGTDKYTMGKLGFSPSNPNDANSVVDELSLLLTAGRLNQESRAIIANAYSSAGNNADGLRLAQKLMISTPEYQSTNILDIKSDIRPEVEFPPPSTKRYKAILYLKVNGGMDSFNMLVPHSGCSGGKTSYHHYQSVRGTLSYPQGDLHQIDASGSNQVCSTFGIHPQLPHLQTLYNSGDLIFFSNVGVLQEKVNKNDWQEKTKIALFAHNFLNEQVEKMDINKEQTGRGMCGRMVDILTKYGYSTGTVSVAGIAEVLVSNLSPLFVADPFDYQLFNPMYWAQPLWNTIKSLNKITNIGSGLFGETWSNRLLQSIGENEILYDVVTATPVDTTFPEDDLGKQLQTIAKIIKERSVRGVDRDVFYANFGAFDTHGDTKNVFNIYSEMMNNGLKAFTDEMKAQGRWDDITIVAVSEFGRTLSVNSARGSDHAWGGNYFMTGGEVRGKRILGEYPTVLSEDGPDIIKPGIVIPSTPWESVWNGVAQWFGIEDADLDEVLPNRNTFSDDLFVEGDLYGAAEPTASPPTAGPPTAGPPTSGANYYLLDRGAASECPIGPAPVTQEECLLAANLVASQMELPDWLNVFDWQNFVPCGCFLWYNENTVTLVDYNTATTGCLADSRTQLICRSEAPAPVLPPTQSPVVAPTPSLPVITPPTSPSNYYLLEKGVASECPSAADAVVEEECLAAAYAVGGQFNFPDVLNVIDFQNFVPCGCFLWFNDDGSMLVDYNIATTGCVAEPRAQMICKSQAPPPTKTPTKAPTNAPTPVVPTITPPTLPSNYYLLEKGVASECPSAADAVIEEECLAAAYAVGGQLNLPDWLNVIDFQNFVPCGCFLWFNDDGSMLVDYNTATTGCVAEPRAQVICKSEALTPTKAPTNAPTPLPTPLVTSPPTKSPSTSPTLSPIQASTNDPTGLSTSAPTNVPTKGSSVAPTQLPTSSTTQAPTKKPTHLPTNTPTASSTASPIASSSAAPTASPTAALTASPTATPTETSGSSTEYVLLDKGVGAECPSHLEPVPEGECLEAAHAVGSHLLLPDWLNKFDWDGLPCGCFLYYANTILVDYNTASVCGSSASGQLICKASSQPSVSVSSPTKAPIAAATGSPTPAPTIASPPLADPSPSDYVLLDKGVGAECPSHLEPVSEADCLEAAHAVGSHLLLPNWLNKFDWDGLPCGCFLYYANTILVDYNTASVCGSSASGQLICKASSQPSVSVSSPTKAPIAPATGSPTPAPTIASPPLVAPSPSDYVLLDKGVGAECPSHLEPVPEAECLEAAHAVGSHLLLPNWLNKFDWDGLPCGCFLYYANTILVDYNTASVCGPSASGQLICKASSQPSVSVSSPTKAPTLAPSNNQNTSSGEYTLLEKGKGSSCPSNMQAVPYEECHAAALFVAGHLPLPNWLNQFTMANMPCGCFLWYNDNGSMMVDYNFETVQCGGDNPRTQMICITA